VVDEEMAREETEKGQGAVQVLESHAAGKLAVLSLLCPRTDIQSLACTHPLLPASHVDSVRIARFIQSSIGPSAKSGHARPV